MSEQAENSLSLSDFGNENLNLEQQSNSNISTSQSSKKKRKAIEPRSVVWSHFTRYTKDEKPRAYCNHCKKDYAANTSVNGTSMLKNHMEGCMKNPYNNETHVTKLNQQPSSVGGKVGSIVTWRFNQEDTRKALTKMIIVDEQPFSFVDKQGFRDFMAVACPSFQIPSRTTITRDCYQFYLEEKAKLKSFLKHSSTRISLTTDSWTSEQRINYMCLTAHFIDVDWCLHKKILNFCPIDSHKGEAIGKGIEKCLLEWGIEKVFTITVDNASSNDVAINCLKRRFTNWGTSLLGGKYLHVRCIAHIINLVVNDGLREIVPSITRVRAAIRYIRQSPSRLKKFKECVGIEKLESKRLLCLDVPTRWNSTYLMLDTALGLVKAFERLEDLDSNYKFDLMQLEGGGPPCEDDWRDIARFVKFLGHFYSLTLRVSGSLYVTTNQVLHELSDVVKLLNTWAESSDLELRQMAKKMKEKYNKYWGNNEKLNLLIFYAVILDPRFKYHYVSWVIGKMFQDDHIILEEKVKSGIYVLFDEYKRLHTSKECQGSSLLPSSSNTYTSCISSRNSTMSEYEMFINETGGIDNRNELDKYIAEDRERNGDEFDILKWWKMNAQRFPILSQMACDIFAVPVSTVASESAFSMGGRVIDSYRSSLTPRMVQCLMCTKDWLRNEAYPINIEEDMDMLEKIDEEFGNLANETSILDI